MTTYLLVGVVGVSDFLNFWEISNNILRTVQDGDIVTMEDR